MNIRYFYDTDTLNIEFRGTAVYETRDLDENTLLDLDEKGNILPVDFVSRAMIRLALDQDSGCFHLSNPAPCSWPEVLAQLSRHKRLETVPYAIWRAALRRAENNPAWIFLPLLPEDYDPAERRSFLRRMCRDPVPAYDTARADAALAALSPCPPFTGAVLERYLSRRISPGA